MSKWAVTTELVISVTIKVEVDADSKDDAIEAAAELLPSNFDRTSMARWKAKIDLTAPKGVKLIGPAKAYHFQQASGNDKARRIA